MGFSSRADLPVPRRRSDTPVRRRVGRRGPLPTARPHHERASASALGTAVSWKPGWIGWALGLFAATGVVLFEFRPWWDYVLSGKRADPPARSRLAGSARYRQAGSTSVLLVATGARPDLVRRFLRFVTELEATQVDGLLTSLPTALPDRLSLASAELVVDGLRGVGAEARLLISGEFVGQGDPA